MPCHCSSQAPTETETRRFLARIVVVKGESKGECTPFPQLSNDFFLGPWLFVEVLFLGGEILPFVMWLDYFIN